MKPLELTISAPPQFGSLAELGQFVLDGWTDGKTVWPFDVEPNTDEWVLRTK